MNKKDMNNDPNSIIISMQMWQEYEWKVSFHRMKFMLIHLCWKASKPHCHQHDSLWPCHRVNWICNLAGIYTQRDHLILKSINCVISITNLISYYSSHAYLHWLIEYIFSAWFDETSTNRITSFAKKRKGISLPNCIGFRSFVWTWWQIKYVSLSIYATNK